MFFCFVIHFSEISEVAMDFLGLADLAGNAELFNLAGFLRFSEIVNLRRSDLKFVDNYIELFIEKKVRLISIDREPKCSFQLKVKILELRYVCLTILL